MDIDIMTLGIPMVEYTNKQVDSPLSEVSEYIGPVAAGDPGITLNACARLGYKASYVGVVGKDALADCFMQELRNGDIDTSHIRVDETATTGISMLTCFSDGSRKFVFTLPTSAASRLGPEDLDEDLIHHVRWIHLSGCSISVSESQAQLHQRLLEKVRDDVMISFDPNYRKELIAVDEYREKCAAAFERCNLFLPSEGEARLFCPEAADEQDACRRIAATGKPVLLKLGSKGCYAFSEGKEQFYPPFPAVEIDSTGAGDSFGGAAIAAIMDGCDIFEAARHGAAAGSIVVGRRGLLNAAPTRAEIQSVLSQMQDQ